MDEDLKRLYVLKGKIGLVGDNDRAVLSFCLPMKEDKLVYLDMDFTIEEMNQSPDIFLRKLDRKVIDLLWSWHGCSRKEKK